MKNLIYAAGLVLMNILVPAALFAQQASNPTIFADVPDPSIIRVGSTYYKSSTTMHMSPGLPIMKSNDLVNWKIVGYVYDTLDHTDELDMNNGKSAYGGGSWASSLRFHKGIFYVSTFSGTTGKTYIYSSRDIERGPWKVVSFKPSLHDHSLFFEGDKVYMVYGAGKIMLAELKADLSGLKPGVEPRVIIENASLAAGPNIGLPAEGSQLFKIKGMYYLFHISWPKGGMRTVLIHRAKSIDGPYEGRVGLQDRGIAQGGLVETPKGDWYAYLFRDFGAVGRIPYLVPVQWKDGWPELGRDGKVPDTLPIAQNGGSMIVEDDDFDKNNEQSRLKLVWQWNHNPQNEFWSLDQRKGFLRLATSRVDTSVLLARNTLTQRTFGPQSSAITLLDVTAMKEGDRAGLLLLQQRYGWVGVEVKAGQKMLVTHVFQNGAILKSEGIALSQNTIYLKSSCDFTDRKDEAKFFYSLDGQSWLPIGPTLKMVYTIPHFMGYRFGLFNYATSQAGGHVDFDYFHIAPNL